MENLFKVYIFYTIKKFVFDCRHILWYVIYITNTGIKNLVSEKVNLNVLNL